MSVAVRVIPCLDVAAGRVVKGVNFTALRDAGDPVELATAYDAAGADELTFLDITASSSDRSTTFDVVRRTAECVFIPLTVRLDMNLDAGYKFGIAGHKVRLGVNVFNLFDTDATTEGSPRQDNNQTTGGAFFVGRPVLPRRIAGRRFCPTRCVSRPPITFSTGNRIRKATISPA